MHVVVWLLAKRLAGGNSRNAVRGSCFLRATGIILYTLAVLLVAAIFKVTATRNRLLGDFEIQKNQNII